MILDPGRPPKRVGIFVVYDPHGIIDRYIPYMLRDLAENLSFLLVVVNGVLGDSGRERLAGLASDILVRDNVGYDTWAYKEGLESIGWDKLAAYDEVLLMNDTVFGPVYPFREAFDTMCGRDLDFWGLTKGAKRPVDPFGKCRYGYFPAHIQSYFTVIRQPMLSSADFRRYWEAMPMIHTWEDAVCCHEVVFTKEFEDKGYQSDVFVKTEDLGEYHKNALMYDPLELVQNRRCPVLKRKNFSKILDEYIDVRCGQSAWGLLHFLKNETYYDVGMIWENVLRICNMADIKMRAQLNFILPTIIQYPAARGCSASRSGKAALFMRLSGLFMLEACKKYAGHMPMDADIIISVTSEENAARVKQAFRGVECKTLRVVVPDKGLFAMDFFAGMREYVEKYDYICFIHDEHDRLDKPIGESRSCLVDSFAYKCYENVLASRPFVENVIGTFEENPQLGLLVPPPPSHGSYFLTVGNEWRSYYDDTKKMADQMGLCVDMNLEKPPVAAFGHCFWFRPQAMNPIWDGPSGISSDPDTDPDRHPSSQADDFLLAMERLYPFVAQSQGYYTGWLLSDVFAKFEITSLYWQLGECYQAIFETFGAMDRLSLFRRIRASKSGLGILREKKSLWEKMKILATKYVGTRGYGLLKKWRDEKMK